MKFHFYPVVKIDNIKINIFIYSVYIKMKTIIKGQVKYFNKLEENPIEIDIIIENGIPKLSKDIIYLDATYCDLTYFVLPQGSKLEILDLAFNESIEVNISYNCNLKDLNLTGCNLTHFEPNKDLESLAIDYNNLTEFIPNKKLKRLSISNNKLTEFKPNDFIILRFK